MGLRKAFKKATQTVRKAVVKPVVQTARKVYSATAPFNPALMGAGLFLQPEQLGIKNKANQKLFDKSQQGTRIVAGATAAYFGGSALLAGSGGMTQIKDTLFRTGPSGPDADLPAERTDDSRVALDRDFFTGAVDQVAAVKDKVLSADPKLLIGGGLALLAGLLFLRRR